MNDIHRAEFPLALSFGVRGGPQRVTEIATAVSGHEQRNTKLSQSRRRWDAGAGIKSIADLETLLAFFEARRGQLYGFLFTDPIDSQSCPAGQTISGSDQIIGEGDGVTAAFTLAKTYGDNAGQYRRDILFPVSGTVLAAVDGAPAPVSFDETARQIVFETPPAAGSIITAGFKFFTPVRFDTPGLDISLETFGAGQAVNVPLIEVLCHAHE